MNIFCVGINHKIAPVDLRERFAVAQHEMGNVLGALRQIDGLQEAVVVSTCNRVEFYTAGLCPFRALEGIHALLHQRAGVEAPLYHHGTPNSIRHLFRVASGLDSMVLGETEILGQVKQAYQAATTHGATARMLNRLFQNAFRVAKSVRSQTEITRGSTSVGSVAVELAGKIFGSLHNRRVMILGAGETSERTARSLVSRGVKTVIVSNRTFDRAARLAEEIGGMAIHFDHWDREFCEVDILISSTAAPHPILTREKLTPLMQKRKNRPLFVIDLAVPRDAEPEINALEGVFLYDIDSLEQIAQQSRLSREQEMGHCDRIIDTNVKDFISWLCHTQQRLHGETPIPYEHAAK